MPTIDYYKRANYSWNTEWKAFVLPWREIRNFFFATLTILFAY